MRTTLRTISKVALAAAGAAVLAATPAAAARGGGGFGGGFHGGGGFGGGYHGGGYGGYRGGYGGYRGGYGYRGYGGFGFGYGCCYGGFYGYGYGDALLGAALIGTTAAVIASDEPYYEAYPAPVYPAYPPPAYAPPAYAPPPGDYGYAPSPAPQQPQQQAYQSTDPVDQCTRAAIGEATARGDTGRVTRIDKVDNHANGARVSGTLEVRRNSHNGETESAHFTCTADYGQVTSFRFG